MAAGGHRRRPGSTVTTDSGRNDRHGNTTRARIVLFRRPLEQRAKDPEELTDLVHDVLVHQVGTYLGVDPQVIDPTLPDED